MTQNVDFYPLITFDYYIKIKITILYFVLPRFLQK